MEMRKIRLILVRHGQTDHNKLKLMQGSGVNSLLNETGLGCLTVYIEFLEL